MSKTERRLWDRLLNRQHQGQKFHRQVPIGPYFADLACLAAGLVVEVDGEHHGEQPAYDRRRDRGVVETNSGALRPPTQPPPAGGERSS